MLRDRFIGGRRTGTFTLQWHITDACENRCAHCYTASRKTSTPLADLRRILDEMVSFCRARRVRGHVCLSGGNPLLHPHFFDLYEDVARTGMETSILGNPCSPEQLQRLVDIQKPRYFQVSLEGLRETDDRIRGAGHFDSVMSFLDVLGQHDVFAGVMLTLSRDNLDQVLPLAKMLKRDGVRFRFNRLIRVGNGVELAEAPPDEYEAFLDEYLRACGTSDPHVLKDGLFNVLLHRDGRSLAGGCTGFGCGAAFNFLAVLPDGEAHACRKFPSPVGNVLEEGLEAAYDSPRARQYRQGCKACHRCPIRTRCGGCLAVAHGRGLDPLEERDPYCFMGEEAEGGLGGWMRANLP